MRASGAVGNERDTKMQRLTRCDEMLKENEHLLTQTKVTSAFRLPSGTPDFV